MITDIGKARKAPLQDLQINKDYVEGKKQVEVRARGDREYLEIQSVLRCHFLLC
ncbi:hypothetical protein NC653_026890 [Populus alba x Populus x berolinensis]|uniref:Uncharacterized protein n=1 Tax=Populus alba x Populus x berolinensis TaxID=444605 RepID=A0AAD6Q674_9ROSI|nr:hypothetical protein NC653_026889 [Populus alba x Populus x berolinensis]KAJ6978593.1 hypothetical protein NC653_026890 [Populus alba x Populus x berolinensis]